MNKKSKCIRLTKSSAKCVGLLYRFYGRNNRKYYFLNNYLDKSVDEVYDIYKDSNKFME